MQAAQNFMTLARLLGGAFTWGRVVGERFRRRRMRQ
jgi:hypothetical protein